MNDSTSALFHLTEGLLQSEAAPFSYEISVESSESYMLRFAQSLIHQNNHSQTTNMTIRLAKDKKITQTSTSDFTRENLITTIHRLKESCEILQDNPNFIGFPDTILEKESLVSPSVSIQNVYEQTQKYMKEIFHHANKNQLKAFGNISYETSTVRIKNSNGLDNEGKTTFCNCQTQMMKDRNSGYASTCGKTFEELEIARVIEDSVKTCVRGENPETFSTGTYPVLLKPEAVADILHMIAYMSLGTKTIEEGRSYLSGKMGQQVVSSKLSLVDHPSHPKQISIGMDGEGFPHTKPVWMIKNGIFSEMVYDHYYSQKLHKPNTGNATRSITMGPFPINLVLESETLLPFETLSSLLDNTILITRFWYSNPLHPKDGEVTALTRDGTFIIQNGKQKPIKNLRYTDNLFRVLSNIVAVGQDSRLSGSRYGGVVTPSLLCESMHFTGILPE